MASNECHFIGFISSGSDSLEANSSIESLLENGLEPQQDVPKIKKSAVGNPTGNG
jgi:hypothetical protein